MFELHFIWSMLSQPAHSGCLLACMRQSIICHPNIHQNAATKQCRCPQRELCSDSSLWTLMRMNYRPPFLKPVYMLLIYSSNEFEVMSSCPHKPLWVSQLSWHFASTTWSSQHFCHSSHLPRTMKSTNAHVHIQEHRKERGNNPGSPWEQMSWAQTGDRLPQPTARLKVLCRAEGGHYCWPFCSGGNIEQGVKRLQGSTRHSHTLLCCWNAAGHIWSETTYWVFCNLQQINCVPFSCWSMK